MDKYEYRVSLNEINSLVQERRFDEAAQIADTIDWRKVKSADTLCRISDIYKICKDYERARDILDIANARNPHVPNIVYSLCELTIFLYGQTGSQADLAKALGLKQEYESECPDDPKRLILEYKFYKVSPVTIEEKIATLEQLRDEDPTARWEYELATLYHQNGQDDLALNECRDIRRAYSGKFADKAAALAEQIAPASTSDSSHHDARGEHDDSMNDVPHAETAAVAEEPVASESDSSHHDARGEHDDSINDVPHAEAPAQEPTEQISPASESDSSYHDARGEHDDGMNDVPHAEAEEPVRSYAPVHIMDEEPAQEAAPAEPSYEAPTEENLQAEQPAQDASESLSVGQVYDEWERIRRDIRKRNDEQRAQRIMQDTGPLLQDFDETARHGLIETIEKEAARQRRQARSGASRILGDDGYEAGYGARGEQAGYREDASYARDRYDDRRYEPLPNQDNDYPEESYPEDNYSDGNYQDEQYADDRYPEDNYQDDNYQDNAPVEEAPVEREAITAETVHEEERPVVNDYRSDNAPRGSAFNAAVAAAAGAAVGAGVGAAASEAEDIATRRWNSDEIRAAMERQKAAAEEQARKEAEEKARQEAEAAARAEAERKAAERAQIEAEVRAQIAAEQKAAQEKAAAEEAARKEAEAKAAAEEQARKDAEAKAAAEKQQMYAEIEARIRAEYEAKLAAAAPVAAPAEESNEVIEEDVEALADDTDDGINQISPEEEPDVPAEEEVPAEEPAHADDLAEAIEQTTADASEYDHIEPVDVDEHEGDHADEVAERFEPARGERDDLLDDMPHAQETSGNPIAPAVSAETDNLPASAASNIASANEKAPSPEELRLFGPFYRMKENRDQVTTALDKISLASYTGNIIITGNAVTARRVAQGLLELTREADSNFTGKIAKATGTALNNLTDDKFHAILSKIENGALIIEHASTMDDAAAQRLYNELEGREHGVIVVLMDARKPIDAYIAEHQAQLGSFTARVDIRPLNDKALVDYGKDYANSKDYALDEMAELALASRISGMQSPSHRVTLKEVRDIIDEAISYASRKTPATLMGMISRKRYDEDDRIILHEKDFQHY